MKHLFQKIHHLSENQAKEVLFHIMQKGMEEESVHDALETALQSAEKKNPHTLPATAIHIVSGKMATLSLRHAFPNEQVIGIEDNLSIGPLEDLSEPSGRLARKVWLRDRLAEDDHGWMYEEELTNCLDAIGQLPKHLPIYIWVAEYAGEQVGMRLLFSLLDQTTNPIYLIPSTQMYRELYDGEERYTLDVYTGEMSLEQLQQIASHPNYTPLTQIEKQRYKDEWNQLSKTPHMVRVFENGIIQEREEDVFDDIILRVVQEQSPSGEFIKATRIVGEVYGGYAHQVGDAFVEYRLLQLIMRGKLEMKGTPKEMRLYSVRMK